MRKFSHSEIDGQSQKIYSSIISLFGLENARKIIKAVNRKLRAEKTRRKNIQ